MELFGSDEHLNASNEMALSLDRAIMSMNDLVSVINRMKDIDAEYLSAQCGISPGTLLEMAAHLDLNIGELRNFYDEMRRFPDDKEVQGIKFVRDMKLL